MSVQLLGWALEQRTGSVSRKAVLLALANCHNHHTGLCCPSLRRLREETELGESTVLRALKDLEDAGYIVRDRRRRQNGSHTSTVYRFPHTDGGVPPQRGKGSPTAGDLEPEVEPEVEQDLAAAPRNGHRTRPTREQRDAVWDTLTDIFGPALTRSAEQLRGKHVASLAEAGATREEIMRRAKAWPAHFDSATLTAAALEKHWDTLARKPLRRRTR